jgi:DNA-directed RNA polymerase specialized sigma24 family protein
MTNGREASFTDRLTEIWQDPRVRMIARRYAGSPDEAEDMLQQAYLTLSRSQGLEDIDNLLGYSLRVIVRMAARTRSQLSETAVRPEDVTALSDRQWPGLTTDGPAAGDFESEFASRAWMEELLARFRREHSELTASVPARSADPPRYRQVIMEAAEAMLRDPAPASDNGWRGDLRCGYPEYFASPDTSPAALAQRLFRTREDMRRVLRELVQEEAPFESPPPQAYGNRVPARSSVTVDETLRALFLQSEQIQLPHEAPYDVGRELGVFTGWLDSQAPADAGKDDPD